MSSIFKEKADFLLYLCAKSERIRYMSVKNSPSSVYIDSEIGNLQAVILHTPGPEVENMTPGSAEKALYSDILNLSVVSKEYNQLKNFLSKVTTTYQVKQLFAEILTDEKVKLEILKNVIFLDKVDKNTASDLHCLKPEKLATALIEGVEFRNDTLTQYLSKERYSVEPLHNFFFTRDASFILNNHAVISNMANPVRYRESLIMDAIFTHHPLFKTKTLSTTETAFNTSVCSFEGGDFLVAREDILLVGTGTRTTSKGIDFLIEHFRNHKKTQHIIVQELPKKPESFIHLDMVFTFLDKHQCMVYEPLIVQPNRYFTVHITIDNGKVKKIQEVENIPGTLAALGMDLELLYCGGRKNQVIQEREQWHSGANFFALGPGKVVGYGRNVNTIHELNRNGFAVIKASDIIHERVNISDYNKYVVTIDGAELSRGGGGCRCMTMPVLRDKMVW